MTLHIEALEQESLLIVSLTGRLDGEAPELFREQIRNLLDGTPRLVLDLARLEYMDSSGLGALISCLRTAIQKGGDIRLARLVPSVRMLLELTRADRIFEVFETREAAISSFDSVRP